MKWININDRTPEKSGVYKVKSAGVFCAQQAHYDANSNHWTYDNGLWLPVSVDTHITHWKEIK